MRPWIPFAVKTGIGSLPHSEVGAALRYAFAHEVPFLPELLARGEGIFSTERACWAGFLEGIKGRDFAKVQCVGPVTAGADVTARAVAMVRAVRDAGPTPIFFFDEPALRGPLDGLASAIAAVQAEGAVVGVHCCGQADWAALFCTGLEVLSFDVRLSLDAVVEAGFTGTMALGVIPTGPGARSSVSKLMRTLPRLESVMLTPACGLGLKTEREAQRIFDALCEAQVALNGESPTS